MIKKIFTAALSGLIMLTALCIVSFSAAKEQEGYPYDDDVNYSYHIETEESFNNKDKAVQGGLAEAYYRFYIRVRDKKSLKILSADRLEISFSGLPSYLEAHGEKVNKINIPTFYYSTVQEPDKPLLRYRDLDIKHYHSVDFQLTSAQSSWADFVKSKRAANSGSAAIDISESSVMGYNTLVLTDKGTPFNKETEDELTLHTIKSVYVYLDDAQIPGGILLAEITAAASSYGTYKNTFKAAYNTKFLDISNDAFEKYSKEFKDEVRKYYNEEMANIEKAINSISSLKPKVTKTIDMQVPYTGSANKADGQKANDDAPKATAKDIIINTEAKETAGEERFNIPAAVVLGLAAAGAAAAAAGAGAAGAAAGSSGDKAPNDEEAAAYQMVIGKDFGNALKFGQKQRVWARMVELKNGAPVDRPDLTAGISIFSREVLVGALSLRGNNVEAEVQIQENAPQEGVISFLYSGGHGSFQNNVRFRLLGKSEIRLASDKVNILSTDTEPFELAYELKNFAEEEPPLEITASSGLVALDLGKNDKQQTVILITPGLDAEQWDGKAFIKPCKCEITVMDGKVPVTAAFEVSVCFEGIGTAFLNTPHNSTPQEILIPCDANEGIREDKTFALPLSVMVWNPDTRTLEPDTAAIKALTMEVALKGTSAMKPGSDAYKKFQTMVEEAKIALCQTSNTAESDPKLSPVTFGLRATGKAADADIELMLTFTSGLPQIEKLTLEAKTSNIMDYKAMIRWLIEYPAGSYASQFIWLGDVNLYFKALDYITGVYQYDRTPNLVKGFRHRVNSDYYEHGRNDPAREAFIALITLPDGIGDLKNIAVLYHELTHTLEDILLDERDGSPEEGCERNAELLKELAHALHHLCDAEKGGPDTIEHLKKAIESLSIGVNHKDVREWLFDTMSTTLQTFGAKYTTLPKELFYHYATDYTGPNTEAVKKAVRQTFCPARLGHYDIVDGLFTGGKIGFRWNHGHMDRMDIECKGFTFDSVGHGFEWVPDKEKVIIKASLVVQKDGNPYKEHINLALESSTSYLFNETQYMNINEFSAEWEIGVPPGKKFYDPPEDSPFYMMRKHTGRLKIKS